MAPLTVDMISFHFMPLAACFGYLSVLSFGRSIYLWIEHESMKRTLLAKKLSKKASSTTPTLAKKQHLHRLVPPIQKEVYVMFAVSLLSLVLYCFSVGQVEGSVAKFEHARFDPYQTLELPFRESNTTLISQSYRTLLQKYHPTNKETGSEAHWQAITLAYRALSDDLAKFNWERHGHPNGPLLTPIFLFHLSHWLLPIPHFTSNSNNNGLLTVSSFLTDPATKAATSTKPRIIVPSIYQNAIFAVYGLLTLAAILYLILTTDTATTCKKSASTCTYKPSSLFYKNKKQSAKAAGHDDTDTDDNCIDTDDTDDTDHDDDSTTNLQELDFNPTAILPTDFAYISQTVTPHLTHWELLTLLVATPGNLQWALRDLKKIETLRREKTALLQKKNKDETKSGGDNNATAAAADKNKNGSKTTGTGTSTTGTGTSTTGATVSTTGTTVSTTSTAADLDALLADEGGWAEDDDDDADDEHVKKAKQAEAEKKKELEQLNESQQDKTSAASHLLEDIDDGVLGQKWVERTLSSANAWPPTDLGALKDKTFSYKPPFSARTATAKTKKEQLKPLDHPAVRRMLCMMSGRLHSQMLNSHHELLQAGTTKKIDQTYFQASMLFRNRIGMLLEATLRVASALKCFSLAKTTVETVAMFKVGCVKSPQTEQWFKALMNAQYGCFPVLNIPKKMVLPPDNETEIICGDTAIVHFDLERTYAEHFLRQKIMMYQKQGIPPQVGLQTYREGWFVTLRCERISDGTAATTTTQTSENPILIDRNDPALGQLKLDETVLKKFEQEMMNKNKQRLFASFPMSVMNVSQKSISLKVPFKAPTNMPGKYRISVDLMSLDFLAADVGFCVFCEVLDPSQAAAKNRPPKGGVQPKMDVQPVPETETDNEPKKEK